MNSLTYFRKQLCVVLLFYLFLSKLVVASTCVEEDTSSDPPSAWRSRPEVLVPSIASPRALFQSCVIRSATFLKKKKKSSAKRKDGLLVLGSSQTDWRTNTIARKHRKGIFFFFALNKMFQSALSFCLNRTAME